MEVEGMRWEKSKVGIWPQQFEKLQDVEPFQL